MKLFQKLLAVTLVAVLALTVFTACDSGSASDDIPSDLTELRYWQTLNTEARSYKSDDGMVLTDVRYSKELSSYTMTKLNKYLTMKNEKNNSDLKYTDSDVTDEFDKINDQCKSAKKYEATVYVISEGNVAPTYKVLYQMDGFGNESTSRFLNADYIGIARVENKTSNGGDGKIYTMMECYSEVK